MEYKQQQPIEHKQQRPEQIGQKQNKTKKTTIIDKTTTAIISGMIIGSIARSNRLA